MPSALQLDLFGAAPPPAPARGIQALPLPTKAPLAPLIPTAPSLEWERLIRASPAYHQDVQIQVSEHWTGVVLELLCEGPYRRRWIFADKRIQDTTPDPGMTCRLVYMTPRDAFSLHIDNGLIPIDAGTSSARFRLARPGERVPGSIIFPWVDL